MAFFLYNMWDLKPRKGKARWGFFSGKGRKSHQPHFLSTVEHKPPINRTKKATRPGWPYIDVVAQLKFTLISLYFLLSQKSSAQGELW